MASRGLRGRWLIAVLAAVLVVGGIAGHVMFPRTVVSVQVVYESADDFQPVLGHEYPLNRFRLIDAVQSVYGEEAELAYLLELNVSDEIYGESIRFYPRVAHPLTDVIIADSEDETSTVVFYKSAGGQLIGLIKANQREGLGGDPDRVWASFASVTPTDP